MRPGSLTCLCLTLIAAALVLASPAAAQSQSPQPCRYFTSCTPVVGPWVSTPSDGDNLYQLGCPDGRRALGADAVFPGAIYPVGIEIAGGLGPGATGLAFAVFPAPVKVTFKPGVGCVPDASPGPTRRAAVPRRYRTRVRTTRIHPGDELRVRLVPGRQEARAPSPPQRIGHENARRRAGWGGRQRARGAPGIGGLPARALKRPTVRDDDEGRLAALRRGDASAFARLVDLHSPAMVRVALA